MTRDPQMRPLIVTAAEDRTLRSLMQCLLSAERFSEHRVSDWTVFDLGLAPEKRQELLRRFPWVRVKAAPQHGARIPHLLQDAASEKAGLVFWFESSTVMKGPLDRLAHRTSDSGFYARRDGRRLYDICPASLFHELGIAPERRHVRGWDCRVVGVDMRMPLGRDLLAAWSNHAAAADHEGAVLNALAACALPEEDLAVPDGAGNIMPVTTGNSVSIGVPLWLDPGLRLWHGARRAGSHALRQLRAFDDTRIDGFKRWRKEHFSVFVQRAGSADATRLASPAQGYFADPFLRVRNGKAWIFAEQYDYTRDCGRLVVIEIDGNNSIESVQPLTLAPDHAALDCHASFPFVFDWRGESYMIPETHERKAIDLFICDGWPARWRLVRRLLSGVDAVDSMVVESDGSWFLLTSVAGAHPNRHLEIHCTDDLLAGPLLPHPINARGLYGHEKNGTGRNAGFLGRVPDGTMMRLMQSNPHHYGEGLCPMRITTLTRDDFAEEIAKTIDLFPGMGSGFPSHHASRHEILITYDRRDRVR